MWTPFQVVLLIAAGVGESAPGDEVAALPVIRELPDPFLLPHGARVTTSAAWMQHRGDLIELLAHWEYGHMPPPPQRTPAVDAEAHPGLDGKATEQRATLLLGPNHEIKLRTACFIPTTGPGPFPVILAVEPVWNEHLRPVAERVVARGYIFAGYERHDLDADTPDRSDGVHPLYPDYDWGSIAVWAWGAMRVTDYLVTLPAVDTAHMALTGHSRAGKVALLAAAMDTRIALAAPHASGAGGASLYRFQGRGAESLAAITSPSRFHYWFHPRLALFADKEDRLPFDQHFLRALVAPRAVLSVDGLDDRWANPVGAQLAWQAAQPVYGFLGAPDKNALFCRPGGHDTTLDDWDVLLDFADHVFFGKPAARSFTAVPFPIVPKAFSWQAPAPAQE